MYLYTFKIILIHMKHENDKITNKLSKCVKYTLCLKNGKICKKYSIKNVCI